MIDEARLSRHQSYTIPGNALPRRELASGPGQAGGAGGRDDGALDQRGHDVRAHRNRKARQWHGHSKLAGKMEVCPAGPRQSDAFQDRRACIFFSKPARSLPQQEQLTS